MSDLPHNESSGKNQFDAHSREFREKLSHLAIEIVKRNGQGSVPLAEELFGLIGKMPHYTAPDGVSEETLREWCRLIAGKIDEGYANAAVDNDGWPSFISLGSPNLPALPSDTLPAWASDYAEATAKATETPRELAVMATFGTISATVAGKYEVRIDSDYAEPLCIWANVALESGARKSAVVVKCTRPLQKWASDEDKRIAGEAAFARSQRETAEARIRELRNQAATAKDPEDYERLSAEVAQLEQELPVVPRVPELWHQDITPERLATVMAENDDRMAIISDEGGIFDILGGRYSNGVPNLDLFLMAHSGSPFRSSRVSRSPIDMPHPALTMVLSPQPDKPGFRGRGLLARFLYALPVSPLGQRKGQAEPVPANVATDYEDGIRALLDIAVPEEPQSIELEADAKAEFWEFWGRVEVELRDGGRFEHIRDWAGKFPGAALRLAGIVHCAIHTGENPAALKLSLETLHKALELASVLSFHALAAFDFMGGNLTLRDARKVWKWIVRNHRTKFTFREAFQALKGSFPMAEEMEPAFKALIERGYIREIPATEGRGVGRPSRVHEIAPALCDAWED